jgi:Acyl-CoA dehydrogenase, middle domain
MCGGARRGRSQNCSLQLFARRSGPQARGPASPWPTALPEAPLHRASATIAAPPPVRRYGNNAVEMETTATWDGARSEFVIHTPSTLAQKYWITNSALHAKWSVVFAQLFMPGERNEGVHAFLVRIRHDDMRPVEGVRIEDMGHKMGCNGALPAICAHFARDVFVGLPRRATSLARL